MGIFTITEVVKIKLSTFNFIDDAIKYKNDNIDLFKDSCKEIMEFFKSFVEENDNTINITYRIKSDESLKEKIIRENFASKFYDSEAFFAYLTDLIGIRIECRFIKDEEKIYEQLLDKFTIVKKNGYHACECNPNVLLKLSEKQPGFQENGFEIYKIDGLLLNKKKVVNFELQIKSMVNLFWGEIDHKILYKNYNYVITEDFIRKIMYSIKEGLVMIDNQMELVSQRMSINDDNLINSREYMQSVVTKAIHDVCTQRLRDDMNLNLDFRIASNLVSDFLFDKVSDGSREEFACEFIRILDVVFEPKGTAKFGEIIEIGKVEYENKNAKRIGNKLVEVMNEDLNWNLVVSIILELNGKNTCEEEISEISSFLLSKIEKIVIETVENSKLKKKNRAFVEERLIDIIVRGLVIDLRSRYFSKKFLDSIMDSIIDLLKEVENVESIEDLLEDYSIKFKEHILDD